MGTTTDDQLFAVLGPWFIGNARSRVTPFIVQINDVNENGDFTDDNDFRVLHIGTTRVAGVDYTDVGIQTFPYADGDAGFTIPAGGTIAAGFMDSNPDGLGGEEGSVVPFDGNIPAGQMWYAGNSGTTQPNPIAVDTVLSGDPAAGVDNRNYQFSIDFMLGEVEDADMDGLPATYEEMFDFLSDDNPDDAAEDEDMDESDNLEEYSRGTDPEDPDTDDDDLIDGHETGTGTWVSATDTGTNPKDSDSDNDGLGDGVEDNGGVFVSSEQTGTDPNVADSDSDTWGDGTEVTAGTDPNDPTSFPLVLGAPDLPDSTGVDGWSSNLVIDEGRSYLNETGGSQVIRPTLFNCQIGNPRSRVTPFIVRLNDLNMDGNFFDDNDFTVMAIGTTRVAGVDYTEPGLASFAFDDADGEFTVEAGERIAAAFIDADPDGLNGEEGSVIPFAGNVTAGEMWYNGQGDAPHPGPAVPLSIGSNLSGPPAADVENRNYLFQIHFETGTGVAFQITEITYIDGAVSLTWNSKDGRVYGVDYAGDLTNGWIEQLDDYESEGEETTFIFPAGATPGFPDLSTFERIFFRVRDVTAP